MGMTELTNYSLRPEMGNFLCGKDWHDAVIKLSRKTDINANTTCSDVISKFVRMI